MSRIKYTSELLDYLKEIAPGRFNDEITQLFNERFGLDITNSQMKSLRSRHKIRSSIDPKERGIRANQSKRLFTDEQISFIKKHAHGRTNTDLTDLINAAFRTSFTLKQIKGWKKNCKVSSGLTGRFEKGHVPINKGSKGMFNVGGNKTSFKKGQVAHNLKPVGTERVDGQGYILIKVADEGSWPQRWKPKHKVEWEKINGPIPEGYVLIFLDGNKQNLDLSNLRLVTQSQNLQMNRKQWRFDNAEATEVGLNLAKIKEKVSKIQKEPTPSANEVSR
ncbi:HNH endonuclease signature motif containing protein [Enterococcus sp. N249-2]